MIRIGKCIYDRSGVRSDPSYEDFTNIVVLMKSHSKYYPLSPYLLKNSRDQIMENIWQFAKLYKEVPATVQKYSRYDPTVIWEHPKEVHWCDNAPTEEYWQWREKGLSAETAIRYPVGYAHKRNCAFILWPTADTTLSADKVIEANGLTYEKLSYVEARKKVYIPQYCRMVKKTKCFKQLQKRLHGGENLLIIDVDGPHEESLSYYKNNYSVEDDFIENDTILATKKNINIMLNDDKHSFGHGYCLALALLEKDKKWV